MGNSIEATLAKGAGGSFLVRIVGTAVSFGLLIFLARLMGVDEYGVYMYVFSWINILVLFAMFGLETTIIRFTAAYVSNKDWSSLHGFIRWSSQLALISSLTLCAIAALPVWLLYDRFGPHLSHVFLIGIAFLPIFVFSKLSQSALRGLKHVMVSLGIDVILRPSLLVLMICLALFVLNCDLDSITVMSLNLLSIFLVLVVGVVLLYRYLNTAVIRDKPPSFRKREWFRVSLHLFFISGAYLILNQTDTIMVGAMIGTTEAGIYASSSRIAVLILFGLFAVNSITAPIISQLYTTGRQEDLQRVITLGTRAIFIFSVPVTIVLILVGDSILGLFGEKFTNGYIVLVVLSVGQLFNSLAGSVGNIMTMTRHEKEAGWIIGGSALLNIILNFALIPSFGMTGAAIATATTIIISNLALMVCVSKYLGINTSIFQFRLNGR